MASSDVVVTNAKPGIQGSDQWARRCLAVALVAPWWLPLIGHASASFYKELLELLLIGFAGVLIAWPAERSDARLRLHPLLVTTTILGLAVVIQSVTFDGVWRKGAQAIAGLVVFAVCLRAALHLRSRFGEEATFRWLAACVVVAAIGSCFFAAMQLFGFDRVVPGVLGRAGDSRLTGNVAQANQFGDLLWVGAIGAVWLGVSRRVHIAVAVTIVAVMVFFAVTSGSRTVWLYVLLALCLGIFEFVRTAPCTIERRMAGGLIGLALVQVFFSATLTSTGILDSLKISTAEQRAQAGQEDSNGQRLWFWRSGLLTAAEHPMLGVGVGRLAGTARERVAVTPDAPAHGADVHAHNLLVQVAGEMGVPAALVLAACLGAWLVSAGASGRSMRARSRLWRWPASWSFTPTLSTRSGICMSWHFSASLRGKSPRVGSQCPNCSARSGCPRSL